MIMRRTVTTEKSHTEIHLPTKIDVSCETDIDAIYSLLQEFCDTNDVRECLFDPPCVSYICG